MPEQDVGGQKSNHFLHPVGALKMLKIKQPLAAASLIFFACAALLLFFVFNWKNPASSVEEWRAELFLAPEKGTFIVSRTFQVAVSINTNKIINAASAEIAFPVDELEVVEFSKAGSIFELWSVEPVYSNIDGTIQFSGRLPAPGFKGSRGKILTITFKAEQEAQAEIEFEKGSVLADGGQETNILKPTRGASYQLTGPLSSDLDSDGYVNSDDLAILFSNWGAPEEPKADINKDGKVDIADLSILFANF